MSSPSTTALRPTAIENAQPEHRPRGLLVAGLALLVIFAIMTIAVLSGVPFFQPFDDAWRSVVRLPAAERPAFAEVFEVSGKAVPGAVLSGLVAIALLATGRWRLPIYALVVGAVAGVGLGVIMKQAVYRERPWTLDEAPGAGIGIDSFPSSHTATAAAFVMMSVIVWRGIAQAVAVTVGSLFVAGMMWQRTMSDFHWLSDTVGALCFVVGVSLILWWALYPWLEKERGLPVFRWSPPQAPEALTPRV